MSTQTENTQETDSEEEVERCPECQMPLEDTEACSFCDWVRNPETPRST